LLLPQAGLRQPLATASNITPSPILGLSLFPSAAALSIWWSLVAAVVAPLGTLLAAAAVREDSKRQHFLHLLRRTPSRLAVVVREVWRLMDQGVKGATGLVVP
jgi:hypothetical protein